MLRQYIGRRENEIELLIAIHHRDAEFIGQNVELLAIGGHLLFGNGKDEKVALLIIGLRKILRAGIDSGGGVEYDDILAKDMGDAENVIQPCLNADVGLVAP